MKTESEIKEILIVYAFFVILVLLGHFSNDILMTLLFLTMGYFTSIFCKNRKRR